MENENLKEKEVDKKVEEKKSEEKKAEDKSSNDLVVKEEKRQESFKKENSKNLAVLKFRDGFNFGLGLVTAVIVIYIITFFLLAILGFVGFGLASQL